MLPSRPVCPLAVAPNNRPRSPASGPNDSDFSSKRSLSAIPTRRAWRSAASPAPVSAQTSGLSGGAIRRTCVASTATEPVARRRTASSSQLTVGCWAAMASMRRRHQLSLPTPSSALTPMRSTSARPAAANNSRRTQFASAPGMRSKIPAANTASNRSSGKRPFARAKSWRVVATSAVPKVDRVRRRCR